MKAKDRVTLELVSNATGTSHPVAGLSHHCGAHEDLESEHVNLVTRRPSHTPQDLEISMMQAAVVGPGCLCVQRSGHQQSATLDGVRLSGARVRDLA